MPSQLIPFKVIRAPRETEYARDVVGVLTPLYYRSYEQYGNLFSYLPYTFHDGRLFDEGMKLAAREEQNVLAENDMTFYLAEKNRTLGADISKQYLALHAHEYEGLYLNIDKLGAWIYDREGAVHELMVAESLFVKEGTVSLYFLTSDKPFLQKDAEYLDGMFDADTMVYHPSTILNHTIEADSQRTEKDIVISYLQEAVHEASKTAQIEHIHNGDTITNHRDAESVAPVVGDKKNYQKEIEVHNPIEAEDGRKDGSIISKVIDSVTSGKNSLLDHLTTLIEKSTHGGDIAKKYVLGNKNPHEGLTEKKQPFAQRVYKDGLRRIRDFINGERDGKTSFVEKWRRLNTVRHTKSAQLDVEHKQAVKSIVSADNLTQVLYATIVYRDALIDRDVVFGDLIPDENVIIMYDAFKMDGMIDASYGGKEAYLQKALVEANKNEVLSEFIELIFMDQYLKEANILEKMTADGRAPIDVIKHELSVIADKGETKSILMKVLEMVKNRKDSGWIERTVDALHHDSRRQAVIEYLKEADDITPDGLMHYLDLAENPDNEGLLLETKAGWDRDKENRPAGLMDVSPLGHWDIDWDDVMEEWKPGWDYLDVPSRDYPYEERQLEIYDPVTGVPHDPLSDASVPNVKVRTPLTHPFPDWSDIGRKEAWVEIFTFQDVLINILGIQRQEMNKIAGMTTHQALQFVLRELHILLDRANVLTTQYQRMFRFVRWYAETITMRSSYTMLIREYDDWTDGIVRTGRFDAQHTLGNMTVQPTGIIESYASQGTLIFTNRSVLNGTFTFSYGLQLNPGSTSELELYIDGVLHSTYTTAGVHRVSVDVPAGNRRYQFIFRLATGERVQLSGFVITGVKFRTAYTEQVDSDDVKGLKAVDTLVQELIGYYVNHHLNKSKGSVGVKQRKIWLN